MIFKNDTKVCSRLLAKIKKSSSCWVWTAYTNLKGYGVVKIDGKPMLAHRASWVIANGPIPVGLCVLHKCDNPPCINPDHLFLGTDADNAADRDSKGRHRTSPIKGENHWWSKLTEKQVLSIRERHAKGDETIAALAKHHSVCSRAIRLIVERKNWKHI